MVTAINHVSIYNLKILLLMFTCMHVSQFLSECLNENQNQHTTKGFPFLPTELDGRSPHFLPWTPNFEPHRSTRVEAWTCDTMASVFLSWG